MYWHKLNQSHPFLYEAFSKACTYQHTDKYSVNEPKKKGMAYLLLIGNMGIVLAADWDQ